jgi:hypothetical protein
MHSETTSERPKYLNEISIKKGINQLEGLLDFRNAPEGRCQIPHFSIYPTFVECLDLLKCNGHELIHKATENNKFRSIRIYKEDLIALLKTTFLA